MIVKVRCVEGGIMAVDVRDADCPLRSCFWVARHAVKSPGAGASVAGSRLTDDFECGRREQRGCPEGSHAPAPARGDYRKRGGVWETR